MEIVFNSDGILKNVIPTINSTNTNLKEAENVLAQISIPDDFSSERGELQRLPDKIQQIRKKSNGIKEWLENAVNRFRNVEWSNLDLMGKIKNGIDNIDFDFENQRIKSIRDDIKDGLSDLADYILEGKWLTDIEETSKETASKVVEKATSAWEFFDENVIDPAIDLIEDISESSEWQFINDKILEPGWDIFKTTGASISNVVSSLLAGICEFVEALVDLVALAGTLTATGKTAILDLGSYLILLAAGKKEAWQSITADLWKSTMGFVAEGYVKNVFNGFYEDTKVGQWLDENAIGIFEHDGIGGKISEGIGYVAGIVLLTIATMGIGSAVAGTGAGVSTGAGATATAVTAGSTSTSGLSFGTLSAIFSGLAGTGKYTEENWANLKEESWQGINSMHDNGEISDEQFNSFCMIKGLSDSEWKEIEEDLKSGLITEEEFNQMKQIREMPDDWRTLENGLRGMTSGVANGVWEGIQWYVGGKLSGWTLKSGSKVASSVVRVGVDTGFNALDTPFRAAMDVIASGKDWLESWTDQGGWQSVLVNTGIGFFGSSLSEIFDYIKIKPKNIDDVNSKITEGTENIQDSIDEIKDKIKKELNSANKKEKVELSEEASNLLLEFERIMSTGEKSADKVVKMVKDAFEDAMSSGNKEAQRELQMLIDLKINNPDLHLLFSSNGRSYWSNYDKSLNLGPDTVFSKDYGIFFHEWGHGLHFLKQNGEIPYDWDEIWKRAQDKAQEDNMLNLVLDEIKDIKNVKTIKEASDIFMKALTENGFDSANSYVEYLKKLNGITSEEAIALVNQQVYAIANGIQRDLNISPISDIIDAVFSGKLYDQNRVVFGHGWKDYYGKNGYKGNNFEFAEIIANFNQLKASGDTERLNVIKDLFGEEFYDAIEEIWKKIAE